MQFLRTRKTRPAARNAIAPSIASSRMAGGAVKILRKTESRARLYTSRRERKTMSDHQISFEDFARFQTSERSTFVRRKYQPEWLNSEEKLRLMLAQLIWQLHCPYRTAGRVPAALASDLETLRLVSTVLFIQWAQNQKTVTKEFEAFARAVVHCGGVLQLFALILWAWRCGEDSPTIAAKTGMTPTAVRQRLFRIRKLADKLFSGELTEAKSKTRKNRFSPRTRSYDYAAAEKLHGAGWTWREIDRHFGLVDGTSAGGHGRERRRLAAETKAA
jgi:hypothetical protein